MKRLSVFVAFVLFLFSCNKEKMNETADEERLVPVRFELSLNSNTRSYFGNLLPKGNIQWGNDGNIGVQDVFAVAQQDERRTTVGLIESVGVDRVAAIEPF